VSDRASIGDRQRRSIGTERTHGPERYALVAGIADRRPGHQRTRVAWTGAGPESNKTSCRSDRAPPAAAGSTRCIPLPLPRQAAAIRAAATATESQLLR